MKNKKYIVIIVIINIKNKNDLYHINLKNVMKLNSIIIIY